jgi:hypothetical protein
MLVATQILQVLDAALVEEGQMELDLMRLDHSLVVLAVQVKHLYLLMDHQIQ